MAQTKHVSFADKPAEDVPCLKRKGRFHDELDASMHASSKRAKKLLVKTQPELDKFWEDKGKEFAERYKALEANENQLTESLRKVLFKQMSFVELHVGSCAFFYDLNNPVLREPFGFESEQPTAANPSQTNIDPRVFTPIRGHMHDIVAHGSQAAR